MGWAYGIPVGIMQKITDIFKENLDGKSFTSFSMVNKHWTRACERDALKEFKINLDKVSYDEAISVGVIWRNIEVLHVSGDVAEYAYEDVYAYFFEKIAEYFPKLRELHISGDMNLMLPSLEIISSMDNLEHLHMEVFNFSTNGVMMMANLPNLKFLQAWSKYTDCKFSVDLFSENNDLLSKEFINDYIWFSREYEEDCVVFGGFEPIHGDELV